MLTQRIHSYCLVIAAGLAALLTSTAHAEPSSPWGVSPSSALSNAPQVWTKDMRGAGVTSVRGFQTNKTMAELEAYAKLALSGFLMWSPDQPLTLPVSHLDGFRRYVTDSVTRYLNRVTSWEVWNEPPNFTADKSPEGYAKVVSTAYSAAKAVSANVRIGLATKSVYLRYLAEAIAAGAADKFDFVSLHPYETGELVAQGCDRPFLGIVGNVRAMLREQNPKRADVPIWFSEVGVELRPSGPFPIDEGIQADVLIKIYTMAIAQGVDRINWFDPRDSEGHHHGLERASGAPRPAYSAYKTLTASLGVAPKFLGYLSPVEDSFGFLFASTEGDVLVTWSQSAGSRELPIQPDTRVLWPVRSTKEQTAVPKLTASPILLFAATGTPLSAAWRKAVSRTRAPWDPAQLSEVAFTPGESAGHVCMVNAPQPTAAGDAEGVSLTGTSAALFAIDPQFLGYRGGEIEITMVARGHGNGAPGFNLKYESRQPLAAANDFGMVGTGTWSSVTGTTPVTFTWNLKDASFSGKYGANVAVDCDSPQFCDFSILSLKIRKK